MRSSGNGDISSWLQGDLTGRLGQICAIAILFILEPPFAGNRRLACPETGTYIKKATWTMNTMAVLAPDAQHTDGLAGERAAGGIHKGAFMGIAPIEKTIT